MSTEGVFVYQHLRRIRDNREPVPIVSSLDSWDDMVLVNLSIPRSAETGRSIQFTCTWQQVQFITNNRTLVRVAVPGTGVKDPLGFKRTADFSGNPIIWHKSVPTPRWSTSEQLGWDHVAAAKNEIPFVHADGTTHLLPSELDQLNKDDVLWQQDKERGLVPGVAADQGPGALPAKVSRQGGDTTPVFQQSSGQWVDVAGHPVAQNPTYGNWYETGD
jgi:hypothetical protein